MGAGLEKTSPAILTCLAHLKLDFEYTRASCMHGSTTIDVKQWSRLWIPDALNALSQSQPSHSQRCACCEYISAPTKNSSPRPPANQPLPICPSALYTSSHHGKERYRLHPLSHSSPCAHSQQLTTSSSAAKSRTIAVRLISMALTGYYRTLRRPRVHRPLSMLKYDPVGTFEFSLPTIDAEEGGGRSNGCSG